MSSMIKSSKIFFKSWKLKFLFHMATFVDKPRLFQIYIKIK